MRIFQSTLPRRERPARILQELTGRPISIHAPAKGATGDTPRARVRQEISIHAPAKGATCIGALFPTCSKHFNPRSREGSDHSRGNGSQSRQISIHAPAKGATAFRQTERAVLRISIHAPAKGATRLAAAAPHHGGISIHAPAKGATRPRRRPRPTGNFNPRSREGSDLWHQHPRRAREISIHAPAKGATSLRRVSGESP